MLMNLYPIPNKKVDCLPYFFHYGNNQSCLKYAYYFHLSLPNLEFAQMCQGKVLCDNIEAPIIVLFQITCNLSFMTKANLPYAAGSQLHPELHRCVGAPHAVSDIQCWHQWGCF